MVNDKPLKAVVHYNICSYLDATQDCGANFVTRAYVLDADKKCVNLIPWDDSANEYQLISQVDPQVKDTDGFFINSKSSNFKVKMVCDPEVKSPLFDFVGPVLVIKASDACGTVDQVSRYIASNRIVFCLLFIALGLALLFFGGYKWDLILGIFGFLTGVGAVLFFFYTVVEFKSNTTSFAVIGALALVIGGIVGYLAYNSTAISYIIIGFPSGYILTYLLLVFLKANLEEWQRYGLQVLCGLLLAIICMLLGKRLMIILTSLIGGILVTFYFGYMVNVLPSFTTILDQIKNGSKLVS